MYMNVYVYVYIYIPFMFHVIVIGHTLRSRGNLNTVPIYIYIWYTWTSQEVSKWLVNGLFHLLINGVYGGYNPLPNLLLTTWYIQICIYIHTMASHHSDLQLFSSVWYAGVICKPPSIEWTFSHRNKHRLPLNDEKPKSICDRNGQPPKAKSQTHTAATYCWWKFQIFRLRMFPT